MGLGTQSNRKVIYDWSAGKRCGSATPFFYDLKKTLAEKWGGAHHNAAQFSNSLIVQTRKLRHTNDTNKGIESNANGNHTTHRSKKPEDPIIFRSAAYLGLKEKNKGHPTWYKAKDKILLHKIFWCNRSIGYIKYSYANRRIKGGALRVSRTSMCP